MSADGEKGLQQPVAQISDLVSKVFI